jgi:hypothetical protein
MANLLNQNIGTNYKGILNLNTLNGNLTSTLQAVTDGDGNASPLQLSTTEVAMLAATFFGASSATTNILTLQSTTRNQLKVESGSTLEFWRSAGVESARFDANGNFLISATSASARLQVRGDGTNPYARFEDNSGQNSIVLGMSSGVPTISWAAGSYIQTNGSVSNIYMASSTIYYATWSSGAGFSYNLTPVNSLNPTSGNHGIYSQSGTFAAGAGSANFRPLNLAYTINNAGAQTGTATGIYLNATETALNGMTHNLMDLQVGGVSRFKVDNTGFLTTSSAIIVNGYISLPSNASISFSGQSQIFNSSDGVIRLANDAGTSFGRLQFGGTTNAFPAIKRNGAGIEFRLADDSDFTGVSASLFTANYVGSSVVMNLFDTDRQIGTGGAGHIGFKAGSSFTFSNINLNVATTSAIVEITSTTKGFLPPRMTTTEKNAIATPASGLVVYDSTLNKLAVYTGSAWETVTSI